MVYDALLHKWVRHASVLAGPTYDLLLNEMVLHTHV